MSLIQMVKNNHKVFARASRYCKGKKFKEFHICRRIFIRKARGD